MRGSATILGLLLLLWMAGSVWWYTCRIKGECIAFSGKNPPSQQELIIDLDGLDKQTYHLRNTGNGILRIEPGSGGSGIGVIRDWLAGHPAEQIDLVAQDTETANGLLAMLIISGVPNNRVNIYADSGNDSRNRPVIIRASKRPSDTGEAGSGASGPGAPGITADPASSPDETVRRLIGEREEEKGDGVEERKDTDAVQPAVKEKTAGDPASTRYVMPCPTVEKGDSLPAIESIFYPVAAYNVRCKSALSAFAAAALEVMEAHHASNIVVTGYTDNSQMVVNNYQLGLARAAGVKEYLVKAGIPEHRIETYSRGGDSPFADNSTEDGRKLNRRVTLTWN
jgi:outer membrane protein OmpA-like peptidoglycan-associated protein